MTTKTDITLLPCPCCGKQNLDHNDYLHPDGVMRVRCVWCHCEAPESAWNRRAAVEAAKPAIIARFLAETGQYVTNDATRQATIDAAVEAGRRGRMPSDEIAALQNAFDRGKWFGQHHGQPAASALPTDDGGEPCLDCAAPAAQEPVAYRVMRKSLDGEWKSDGRDWCDGRPSADLVADIAKRSDGWRIEYAYATAPVAAQAQQIHPAVREGVEAAFEQRPGWLKKIGAAVRYLPDVATQAQHPDDTAVDRFAAAMKAKLAQKRAEGRGGWEDKTQCDQDRLSLMLRGHVAKGDPVDVANFAMMLHQRGERISGRDAASPSAQDLEDAQRWREVAERFDQAKTSACERALEALGLDDVDAAKSLDLIIDAARAAKGGRPCLTPTPQC